MAHEGRRKVLMVLESNYPTEGGGGAEGQLRTITRYLRDHGIPVSIIVPMRADGVQQEHDCVDNVHVWRVPYPKFKTLGGVVLLTRLVRALWRRRHEYDVIHAHMANNMAAVCSAVGWLLGKPVIVKITGSLELDQGVLDSAHRSPTIVLKRRLFRCATWFQATSSEIRERLVENGIAPERVRVIPNAVDLARFDAARHAPRPDDAPLTAVCVGRLSEEKAPDVLLAAWMEAFPPTANAQLLLVGDGRMRDTLAETIAASGRGHQIRLLGPQDDVAPFLAQADFAILPSHYEGLSNALLEYMAAGLPVLGTRVSGNVDFIEPGRTGWLVDPGDVPRMAAQLRAVAAMQRATLREMGEVARQRVAARARLDSVMGQLAELYEIDAELLKQVPQNKLI